MSVPHEGCGCATTPNQGWSNREEVADKIFAPFPAIYAKLIAPLPEEAIEKTDKAKTRRGYDTTGFQYQYLVDRLNEAIGIDGWAMDWKIIKEIPGTWGADKKSVWELVVEVTVIFYTKKMTHMAPKDDVYRKCVGCHKAEMYGDALKGAITNGFKKTVAFFGLGAQAYRGTIDDDYMPIPNIGQGAAYPYREDKGGVVVGFVSNTSVTPGEIPVFKITMDNGETYKTPAKDFAEIAKKAKEEKAKLKIHFIPGNLGYQIDSLTQL